jgi:arsenate reductase
VGFLGSPSIRVNGVDLEGKTAHFGRLCCRTYEGGSGIPSEWLVEAAVLRALSPRGVLFLCVANSARSQLAEGIARCLAPPAVTVWSAGSSPTRVRPEAIAALAEIGIDISHHQSKAVSDIPAADVDTVITLCGEEECPVFLGRARRLHWGLPDPASVGSSEADRVDAFRRTRDELRRRLAVVFAHNGPDRARS